MPNEGEVSDFAPKLVVMATYIEGSEKEYQIGLIKQMPRHTRPIPFKILKIGPVDP